VHAAPAAADITDASATGISLVTAASAAAARTAIGAASSATTVGGAALSGDITAATLRAALAAPAQLGSALTWTPTNRAVAGASATHADGVLTITHDGSVTSLWDGISYTAPEIRAPWTPADSSRWSIVARLTMSGGFNATTRGGFGLVEPGAVVNRIVGVRGDGLIFTGYNVVGTAYNPTITGATAVMPLDGTGWVRITRREGTLTYEYGTGTTTVAPTTWTTLWTETLVSKAAASNNTLSGADQNGTVPGTIIIAAIWQPSGAPVTAPIVTWDTIRIYDL